MKSSSPTRKCALPLVALMLSSVGCWVEAGPPARVVHVEHEHEHEHHPPPEDSDGHHQERHEEHHEHEHEHHD